MNNFLVIFVSLAFVSACGKKDESKPASSTGIAELQGTWISACHPYEESDSIDRLTEVYSGTTAVSTRVVYSDAACTVPELTSKLTATASAAGDAATPAGAKKINYTISGLTLTPNAAAIVSDLNANGYCGFTDWALNTEKNLVGSTCDEEQIMAGEVIYAIYKLNSATEMSHGMADDTYDQSTEAKRPIRFDTFVYTKQ